MFLTAAFLVVVFLYSLFSRKLDQTVVSAPIVFTAAGASLILVAKGPGLFEGKLDAFLILAEVALVMTLFTDATRISLSSFKGNHNLPLRLLSTGLLLTIVLGTVCAKLVFPSLSWWEAGILSAILTPTDAGLGQIIVSSPKVPIRIRQALNVEAGLNDGLAVPFLMFFIALAAEGTGGSRGLLGKVMIEQLGYGTLVGVGIGLAGGLLLGWAQRRDWLGTSLRQLALFALPLLCMLASEHFGASMFIAAFVAGLAVQVGYREAGKHSIEFTEAWGQLFIFFVFFLFGLKAAKVWHDITPALVLYAALSLTIVRILPVAIALIGTKLKSSTVLFIGWFGPRGLASIVLGLVYFEHHAGAPVGPIIPLAVIATVLISILAHGLSALPGMNLYAKRVAAMNPDAPELQAGAASEG